MSSLLQRLTGGARDAAPAIGFEDYVGMVGQYGLSMGYTTTMTPEKTQPIGSSFGPLAAYAQGSNGVVFACMAARQMVFSAVRLRWQRLRDGKPSDTFGTADLELFERPWVGGTTQDLLSRMIQYADLAGNAFTVLDTPLTRLGGDDQAELVQLRPDWVQVVVERRNRDGLDRFGRLQAGGQLGWRKRGYVYTEGGDASGNDGVPLLLDEVSHFMPIPDPLAPFRGMSWLTPVIREIESDSLMNRHRRKYFENGATPNMIITHAGNADRERILDFNKRLQAENSGVDNAYKTLNLYPGADVKVVGSNMEQLDFRQVQGAGETRIAAAAGTPPVIVGLSEGLAAATYSNYAQARRRFGDGTIHPLWQNAAGSLEVLMGAAKRRMPSGGHDVRLWYDADNVPFLREDEKDAAEIASIRAQTIRSLIDAGYEPSSVVAAVEADDFRILQHTGLFSVQLQPAGSQNPGEPATPAQSTPSADPSAQEAS